MDQNEFSDFLQSIPVRPPHKPRQRKAAITTEFHKYRYYEAHEQDFKTRYQAGYKGGHYFETKFPNCSTANGLTQAVVKFLLWSGHRATRINSTGRVIKVKGSSKYIPGTTRKGTADVSATIKGRAVMLEIKVGKDVPSKYQLDEQARERAAGGCYEFIHGWDEFILWYDKFMQL